ncbi:MAG: carbon-nitrogen hydrolase family protein [Chloroflexi bacterium]|nr:carbon-nitrogen hydrolase family protein [Chloroflexota bacterium]
MRAAAIQFFATPFDLNRNLQTAERLIRQAASQGAHVVVLPELFNTGYVYNKRLPAAAESGDGPTLRWLTSLSAELNIIIAGTLLLREQTSEVLETSEVYNSEVYNVFMLAEPGGKIHRYRKQYPFLWEHCYFEAGRGPLIAETALGRIGLMVCWDIAHDKVWEQYRGKVDVMLIASSPPRFHRAVLNFPLGKKVYLAEMMPTLLRQREAIDRWYFEDVASRAAWLGSPVVHAVMAGRFVTEIPFPRLSFWLGALMRPRLWPLAGQAHLATLRATFYGTSAVFDSQGGTLARVEGEEGIAVADVSPASGGGPVTQTGVIKVPAQLRVMEALMKVWARR